MTLKRALFFPYPYEGESLPLSIEQVIVDGRARTGLVRAAANTVALHEVPGWSSAKLLLSCEVPEDLAARVLPEDERGAPPWRCTAVTLCRPTRWRAGTPLEQRSATRWGGDVELRAEEVQGPVRLTVVLTRTAEAEAKAGAPFARAEGARLASSHSWTIQVTDPHAAPGRYLAVRWENFAASTVDALRQQAKHVYFLELDSSRGAPVLWLNSGVEDLQSVLDSKATHGPRAATRNALFDSIAQTVWVTLVVAAAEHLADRIEEEEDEAGAGWQELVLEAIAPGVFPDLEEPEAARRLALELRTPARRSLILQSIVTAVQDRLDLVKSTRGLISSQEGEA